MVTDAEFELPLTCVTGTSKNAHQELDASNQPKDRSDQKSNDLTEQLAQLDMGSQPRPGSPPSPSRKRTVEHEQERLLNRVSSPPKRIRDNNTMADNFGRILTFEDKETNEDGLPGSSTKSVDKDEPHTPAPQDKQRRHSVQIRIEDSPAPSIRPEQTPAKDSSSQAKETSARRSKSISPSSYALPESPESPGSAASIALPESPESPSSYPLPDSPEDHPGSDPVLTSPRSHDDEDLVSDFTPPPKRINYAVEDNRKYKEEMKKLFKKADAYSQAVAWEPKNKQMDSSAQASLDKIHNDKNRFNHEECVRNEAIYQARISAIIEEKRREDERIEAVKEAARAEERRKFEEEQARLAAEQERFRLEEMAKQAALRDKIERARQEAETQRLAEEAEKAAAEAKHRQEQAAKDQAEAAKKAEAEKVAAAAKQALLETQREAEKLANSPGRTPIHIERQHINRVIKNLSDARDAAEAAGDWVKTTGLRTIVRFLRPKFGQLTGEKTQTVALVGHPTTIIPLPLPTPLPTPYHLTQLYHLHIPLPAISLISHFLLSAKV